MFGVQFLFGLSFYQLFYFFVCTLFETRFLFCLQSPLSLLFPTFQHCPSEALFFSESRQHQSCHIIRVFLRCAVSERAHKNSAFSFQNCLRNFSVSLPGFFVIDLYTFLPGILKFLAHQFRHNDWWLAFIFYNFEKQAIREKLNVKC